jgi:guanylate kinase
MTGAIFVISGPSGSGKTTITSMVRARIPGIGYSVSHTTRPPRPGEKDGREYHFVSRRDFEEMKLKGLFAETAEIYGSLYGTSRSSIEPLLEQGLDVVMDVDHCGAFNIRSVYKESSLIYIMPPSLEVLRQRLSARASDSPDSVERRLSSAMDEMRMCFSYDFVVINEDLEKAFSEVASVITANRCRTGRRMSLLKGLFPGLEVY